jgi:hypothetical protein
MVQQFRNRVRIFDRESEQRIVLVIGDAPDDRIAHILSSAVGSRAAATAQREQNGDTP